MANLSNIIKVTQAQYLTLLNGGTITKGGVTYSYDSNAFYVVEDLESGKKYLHNIQIVYSNTYIATFSLINERQSTYGLGTTTNWSTLVNALNEAGFNSSNNTCPAQGQFWASLKTNLVTGVYYVASGVMGFTGLTIASTSANTMTFNEYPVSTTGSLGASATIYDVVVGL